MITTFGLLISLFGPILIASFGSVTSVRPGRRPYELSGLAALIGIVAGVLFIVLRCEHQPLSSLGLKPFRWSSLAWGLALAIFFMRVFAPAAYWTLQRLNLKGFETGLAKTATLPNWYLTLAIVIGATAEEILYRGYAVERLAVLTGSYWIAGVGSVLVFGIAHVPMWGWGPALTTIVSGGVLTSFFIWRFDLTANVIAHVLTDLVGIVVVPLLARKKVK
ncbi:MAG: CPBP family intramembrane metalloprotease [Deltaproteobacteria bacterium]|nr:CPBP family intramembrane metalloprotease [Deltaproteobacteria bacterium]